jgi:16S rRNA G966 N2-methylase RsmD
LSVTSVDRDPGCIKFIQDTAKKLQDQSIKPVKSDVFKYLSFCKSRFDLIFADPPFDAVYRGELHQTIFEKNLLDSNGILVIEHASSENLDHLSHFDFCRKYGNVAFSFFNTFDSKQ